MTEHESESLNNSHQAGNSAHRARSAGGNLTHKKGISQIVNLSAARSWTVVPGGFFVVPVLVLIAGVVVLFNPFTAATVPFIILGVSSIVYGLSDLVNIIRFRQKKDIQTPIIEDVTPIEEIKD